VTVTGEAPRDARDLLDDLDMSASQRCVYEWLCRLGSAEPRTLAEHTGLAVAEAVRALGALQAHGLAVPSGTAPTWSAAAPTEMLENLLLDQEERLRELRVQVDRLMAAYHHAAAPDVRDVVEVISGRQAIQERWHRLQSGARHQLLVLDKPPHVQRFDAGTELRLLARGVVAQVVYEQQALLQPGALDQVRQMTLAGEQARIGRDLPFKLAVVDARRALMPLAPGVELDSALLVRPSTLLDALVATFDAHWTRAVPLTDAMLSGAVLPDVPDAAAPDDDAGRLVALLAAGLTDEAIARQLGVSARTVQRRVSELMERLGARNRFQAGIQIAHRGLA
jgi:sugar-specific transcriptional regulator TrmB